MQFNEIGREIIEREARALFKLAQDFPTSFADCVTYLLHGKGRVAVSGIGKSGHIGKKIAATLSSTGTPAFFIHPTEALHGDLGMLGMDDTLLVLSNSGNTVELFGLLDYAARNGILIIGMTGAAESMLARQADFALIMPTEAEACPLGCAPTTSTTLMLALGDALAMTLLRARGFTEQDFNSLHPGGTLGKRLRMSKDIMRHGADLPLADVGALMSDVVLEMSSKRLGCVGVVSGGRLEGIITDGDLRRHMSSELLAKKAREVMTVNPYTVMEETPLSRSMGIMKEKKITVLFVVDAAHHPVGVVHLHDCLAEKVC